MLFRDTSLVVTHFTTGQAVGGTALRRSWLGHYLPLLARITAPVVDVHVTRPADHEGLAFSRRHDLNPLGLFLLAFHVQVAKRTDVVDVDVLR